MLQVAFVHAMQQTDHPNLLTAHKAPSTPDLTGSPPFSQVYMCGDDPTEDEASYPGWPVLCV